MDDVHPPFHPPRYPTDGDSDFDTRLVPTASIETDPSKSSYPTHSIGSYRLEPSQPLVIRLTSDSSASSGGPAPPPVRGRGFIHTRAVPHGHGPARGGGRGDITPSGFENSFLLSDE